MLQSPDFIRHSLISELGYAGQLAPSSGSPSSGSPSSSPSVSQLRERNAPVSVRAVEALVESAETSRQPVQSSEAISPWMREHVSPVAATKNDARNPFIPHQVRGTWDSRLTEAALGFCVTPFFCVVLQ